MMPLPRRRRRLPLQLLAVRSSIVVAMLEESGRVGFVRTKPPRIAGSHSLCRFLDGFGGHSFFAPQLSAAVMNLDKGPAVHPLQKTPAPHLYNDHSKPRGIPPCSYVATIDAIRPRCDEDEGLRLAGNHGKLGVVDLKRPLVMPASTTRTVHLGSAGQSGARFPHGADHRASKKRLARRHAQNKTRRMGHRARAGIPHVGRKSGFPTARISTRFAQQSRFPRSHLRTSLLSQFRRTKDFRRHPRQKLPLPPADEVEHDSTGERETRRHAQRRTPPSVWSR